MEFANKTLSSKTEIGSQVVPPRGCPKKT